MGGDDRGGVAPCLERSFMSELLHNLFFAKKENMAHAMSRVSRTQHRLFVTLRSGAFRAPQASKVSYICLTLQSTIFARI